MRCNRLILKAGSGYTNANPELHLMSSNQPNSPEFSFNHFHNYDSSGNRIETPKNIEKVHSFFGLVYYSPNNDGHGLVHPSGPQN